MSGLTGRGGGQGGPEPVAAPAEELPACGPVAPGAARGTGVPGLDALGWPVEGSVPAVRRAILAGAPVTLRVTGRWPLPALPENVAPASRAERQPDAARAAGTETAAEADAQTAAKASVKAAAEASAEADEEAGAQAPSGPSGTAVQGPPAAGAARTTLWVTDEVLPLGPDEAVLRPPSLTVGIGAGRGVGSDEVIGLIERTLDDAGLSMRSVAELATVDAKAGEPGLLSAADRLDLPLRTYAAGVLAEVEVPNPSRAPQAAVGTPSVAEAAALTAAGEDALLVAPKAKSVRSDGAPPMAAAAVARRRP